MSTRRDSGERREHHHPGATCFDGVRSLVTRTGIRHLRNDVGSRPFLVLFELTRACDLASRHCRATATRPLGTDDLATGEVIVVLEHLASRGSPRPIVVLTGGDPLKGPDRLDPLQRAVRSKLTASISPAAAPRATPHGRKDFRRAGVTTVSFSVGSGRATTDHRLREVQGSLGDPSLLHERCARCERREPRGGPRSEAFVASRDALAEEPSCPSVPVGTLRGPRRGEPAAGTPASWAAR